MALADLKYFTGAQVININAVNIPDASVFANFTELREGILTSCGITDVSAFSSLDLTKIEELNFTGNNIQDWTALEAIADKVVVSTSYTLEMAEDGNYTFVPLELTLADQMAQDAESEGVTEGEEEAAEETTDEAEDEETEEPVAEEATEATDAE